MIIVRIQSTRLCKATRRHRLPAQTGHWTHWTDWTLDTLDTSASAQAAVAAKTGALVVCTALCSGRETCGKQAGGQRKNMGHCPVCVQVRRAHCNFYNETPSAIYAAEDPHQLTRSLSHVSSQLIATLSNIIIVHRQKQTQDTQQYLSHFIRKHKHQTLDARVSSTRRTK